MNFNLQLGSFQLSLGKSVSPTAWARGDDLSDGGQGARLVSPYDQSSWVYICISRLAAKVAQIPFRISRIGGGHTRRVRQLRGSSNPAHREFCRKALNEDIQDSGDVVDLFNRPHPTMTRQLFWEMVVTWLALRGEFFILPLDAADTPVDLAERSAKVARMLTLPTEMFWHIVQGYDLTAWRYTGSPLVSPLPSEMLLPTEVVHCRTPNPYLYWRGMSPLLLAAVPAGSDYAAAQYAKGYWLNNADTGVIVTTEQQASPEQQAAILAALRERKRKAGTADRPLFLWGGAKVEKPQLSGMETQFIENRTMNRQEIGAIYGVPDSVMGFNDAKASGLTGGGAAIDAEQASFIENTIGPICAHIEASVEAIVKTFDPDFVGWFDLDALPVMQAARRSRLDSAGKAFALGVPFNDINEAFDLGFPQYPWGKNGYLAFNLQNAGDPQPLPGEDDPAPKPDDDKEEKGNPFLRFSKLLTDVANPETPHSALRTPNLSSLWKSHVAARNRSVKVFSAKCSKVIHQFRVKTLAKLDEVHLEKGNLIEGVATRIADLAEKRSLIDIIFDQHDFGKTMLETLSNPIVNTLQLAGTEMNQEMGLDDPWKLPPKAAKEYLQNRTQPIHGIGGTVRDQLNTTLQQGLDAGESHKELRDRVSATFGNLQKHESDRIARTEVNLAYNNARDLSMKDAGIEYKAWLSSHGPNVREAHADAEERYIDDPIPLDEPFEIGEDQMMFPGDDSLGAELANIINCQCIQLAAEKKEEGETEVVYFIHGLGKMKFGRARQSLRAACGCEPTKKAA